MLQDLLYSLELSPRCPRGACDPKCFPSFLPASSSAFWIGIHAANRCLRFGGARLYWFFGSTCTPGLLWVWPLLFLQSRVFCWIGCCCERIPSPRFGGAHARFAYCYLSAWRQFVLIQTAHAFTPTLSKPSLHRP